MYPSSTTNYSNGKIRNTEDFLPSDSESAVSHTKKPV